MAKTSYDIPTVRKTISIINLLCESQEALGLSEISKKLGMSKNMAFRILSTLRDENWITTLEDTTKYCMTFTPYQTISKPIGRLTIRDFADEPLRKLWTKTKESIFMGILYEDEVLYIEHHDSTGAIKIAGTLGGRYPLHCTAPGKVFLANLDDSSFAKIAKNGFKKYTDNTLTSKIQLKKHLDEIKQQGWALDDEEYGRGLICFAVPIFDHSQQVVAAIGSSVTTISYTKEEVIDKLGPSIIETGKLISQKLGCV